MGLDPIAYFRAFPMTRETLCSEPVVAWAQALGRAPIPRDEQEALWLRLGTLTASQTIADRMGLDRIDADQVCTGDAVMLRCADEAYVLGVNAGKFSVAATSGRVHVGRFQIQHGWRLT